MPYTIEQPVDPGQIRHLPESHQRLSGMACRDSAWAKLSAIVGVIVFFCFINVFAAIAADSPKVLVLHSYHSGFQWTDDQNAAIVKSLQSAYPKGDIFVEYMNTKRVALEVMSPMLRHNYATLYRNAGLNLIITTDNNALDFMLKYGDELFPGVPVVFCGINNFDDYNLSNHRNYTGVREDFDTAATLDVALRFHPNTHTVAMIADVTESSQITLKIAREVAKKYRDIKLVELSGLSETVLAEELGKLKQGTVILLLSYYRSPEGRVFSVKDGVRLVQKQTQLPVYALWDFYMLPPVIGGKVTTGALQGKAAAEIAIRILKGEKTETIAPYSCPTSYYFNYDALQKHDIPASLIPANSIVAGKPDTIYSKYKTSIQVGAAIALGLIVIILILLRSLIIQRRHEALLRVSEEKYRVLFENAIEGVFQLSPEGRFLSVNPSLCRILGYDSSDELMTSITDSKQQLYVNPEEHDILFGADPGHDENPGFELQVYRKNGQKIWVSMSTRLERDADGQPLKLEGIVSDITNRKRMEEEILKLNAELSATLQTIPDLLFELDLNGTYLNIWTQNPDLLVAQKEQLLGHTVHEMLSVEAAETIMAALREADQSGSSFGKVIRIDFPEGPKWFELSVSKKSRINGVDRHFILLSRDITERKQMEEMLAARERKFRTLAENSPDNISRFDSHCRQIYLNPTMEKTFGLNPAWLLGKTPIEQATGDMPRDLGAMYEQSIRQVIETGDPGEFEMRMPNPVGGLDTHLIRIVAERNDEGAIIGALAIGRDITAIKQAEEQLNLLSFALDHVAEAVYLIDERARFHYVNEMACQALGYSYDELIGHSVLDIDPDFPAERWPDHWRGLKYHGSLFFETRHIASDGHVFPVEICANYFEFGGQQFNLAMARDITERKQAEQQLMLMNFALDHVGEAAYLIDEKACLHYVNEEACRALGYSRDELLARSIKDIDPDFPMSNWPDFWRGLKYHGSLVFETRHIASDGHIFPVEICANYFEFGGQQFNLAMARDITERKRVEQELQEREQQFRTLAENLPDNVARYDLNCLKVYVNPQLEKTLGRSAVSLVGLVPFDGHGEEFSVYQQSLQQVLADGQDAELDLIVLDAEKGERYHNIRFVTERDADGTVTGAMVIGRDITDRKLMEETLAAREQEYRTLADNSPDNINRYDIGCRYVYVNPQFEKTMGIAAGSSVLGKTPLELDSTEQTERYMEKIKWVFETGKGADFDVILPDTGEGERHHNIRFVAERGSNNEVTGVLAIGRDITERMRMETLLQKKGQMLEEAQRIAHVGSWELDLATNRLTWSDEVFRIFEITPAQFDASYEVFLQQIHPDDREMVNRAYTDSVASHMPYDIEHRLLFPDGRIKYIQERCETYYNADGMPLRSMGTAQDVTERRMIEENLRTKQHKLAELELELSFAEERERQRIAAVLHDHIGQLLLLGRIKLGALLSNGQPPATEQTVSDVRTLMDEAIQSTRSLTVQLCPPVLSTMGLEPALELLCRQMLEEWGLQVAFSDDLQPKPLSPEVRTVLYQTARELLINVGKHACTKRAQLAISRVDAMFVMIVSDSGTGFDPDALAAASRQAKGFGLFNVMRRIRNLGGEINMDSSPLQGTRITIRIPLDNSENKP